MIDQDKKSFAELMKATLGIYDKEITKETLVIWWNALSAYSIEIVREALSRHVKDKANGRFAPKPADVIAMIDRISPDGRPGADEAWAIYPRSEADSAVLNDEISYAAQVAQPLLDEGDTIAARMAFKDAYNRIVEQNKANGIKPKWFPSLGHNPDGRKAALDDAVNKNRISLDYAQSLLPAPKDGGFVAGLLGGMKLLTKSNEVLTDEQRKKNRQHIAKIKNMLRKAA
jgi:hypothetical protein